MGSWHDYAINGMVFTFVSRSGLLDCDWPRNVFQNGDCFPFSYSRLVLLAKQCVQKTRNNINVGFLSVKENWAPKSKLCTFYCRRSWKLCCSKGKHTFHLGMLDNTHLLSNFELTFASLRTNNSLWANFKKTKLFVIQKEYCGHYM